METLIIIGMVLALGAVLNATLLVLVVLKQRKFYRNGGQLLSEIQAFDNCTTPEAQRAALIATCEHFRRGQMMWIEEADEARKSGDPTRQIKAEELAVLFGEVYVKSSAFYRQFEIRA